MKMHAFRPIVVAVALAFSIPVMFSGCVAILAAGAAGGAVAYVRGALNATLSEQIEDVQKAVKQSIRNDLKFTLISAKEDAVGAEYEARTSRDDKIIIRLDRASDSTTKIQIRVGVFGDEAMSWHILETIKTRLS